MRLLERRAFIIGAGAVLAVPAGVRAQPRGPAHRVAYLGNSSPELEADLVTAFREGLRELGYVEGESLAIDYRWARGRYEAFPALVREAIAAKPDVIVTAGTPGALAAQRATKTIPIVLAVIADPVGVGIVPSLARPGGNVTGSATMLHDLAGKRLEVLKELLPRVSRIAVVWNPGNPANEKLIEQLQAAARVLHITIAPLIDGGHDRALEQGLAAIARARVDALVVEPDRALLARRERMVAAAAKQRLPAVYPYREYVEGGGLASYAPNFPAMFRRAAGYVDKILKGASAGTLPIEQPTSFELSVNLRTARALGLAIPPSLLLRADRVIE